MDNSKILEEKDAVEKEMLELMDRRRVILEEIIKPAQQELTTLREKDLQLDAAYKTLCKLLGIEDVSAEFTKAIKSKADESKKPIPTEK